MDGGEKRVQNFKAELLEFNSLSACEDIVFWRNFLAENWYLWNDVGCAWIENLNQKWCENILKFRVSLIEFYCSS